MSWKYFGFCLVGWLVVQILFLAISTRMLWAWWMTWLPSIFLSICLLLIALVLGFWAYVYYQSSEN